MKRSPTILVTGSAGRIGQAVVRELTARGHCVRGFDLVPTSGVADGVTGDIADADAVLRAARGTQSLIHLAATPDDDDFLSKLVPNNIVGVHHVMEAARLAELDAWLEPYKRFWRTRLDALEEHLKREN